MVTISYAIDYKISKCIYLSKGKYDFVNFVSVYILTTVSQVGKVGKPLSYV